MAPQRMGPRRVLKRGGKRKRSMKKIRKNFRNARRNENNRRMGSRWGVVEGQFVTYFTLCQATLYLNSVALQRARVNIIIMDENDGSVSWRRADIVIPTAVKFELWNGTSNRDRWRGMHAGSRIWCWLHEITNIKYSRRKEFYRGW